MTDESALAAIDNTEQAMYSLVPMFQNPRKTDYLGNRACGFTVREACALASITFGTLCKWRNEDAQFAEYEVSRLRELQQSIGPEILKLQFLRNMKMALRRDFRVFWKALYNFDNLTAQEFDYLKTIRKHYTPADLLALEKALQPAGQDGERPLAQITILLDGEKMISEEAKRAAARDLLNKFVVERQVIEGEFVESGNGDS
jgi:hypothetical protein